jgi:NADH-quinone oxidoreductase subunit N
MTYTTTMFLSILPEILLLLLGIIILIVEPFWKGEQHRNAGWLTAGGLLAVMAISLVAGRPGQPEIVFGGMLRYDWLGFFFKMMFIFGAAITALFMVDHPTLGKRGESYVLLVASTLGMSLMASAADLVMLYLAIETTSIPLYVLAGFMLSNERSTEAGFKYLLYGAMTSAIMLYGFSLLFGFTGTTNLYELGSMAVDRPVVPGRCIGAGDAHRGRARVQGFDCPIPLLGSGCLYRRADPGGRFLIDGFQSSWVCCSDQAVLGRIP